MKKIYSPWSFIVHILIAVISAAFLAEIFENAFLSLLRNLFPPVADYAKMYRTASDLSDITIANVLLTIILLWLYIRVRPICKFIGTATNSSGRQGFRNLTKYIRLS